MTTETVRLDSLVRHQRGDILPIRTIRQGAVRVNEATVERDYGDCLLVYVDMHSKRAELFCVGSGDNCGPSIYLTANEQTLHLDETMPKDSITEIEFENMTGWRIFAADGPSRYTLSVTLIAAEKETPNGVFSGTPSGGSAGKQG